jgi:hypothetical protein
MPKPKPKPKQPYIQKDTNVNPAATNQPPVKIIPAPIASTVEGALAAAEESVREANNA